jgi:hypothetical protein
MEDKPSLLMHSGPFDYRQTAEIVIRCATGMPLRRGAESLRAMRGCGRGNLYQLIEHPGTRCRGDWAAI